VQIALLILIHPNNLPLAMQVGRASLGHRLSSWRNHYGFDVKKSVDHCSCVVQPLEATNRTQSG
jgi:hypothetical protein